MGRSLAAVLASALLLIPGPSAGLGELAGGLRSIDPITLLPGDPVAGYFDLAPVTASDDLRTAPGRLTIRTSSGRLEAAALTAYGPANRDPLSGRPRRIGADGPCTGNVFGGLTHRDPSDLDFSDGQDQVPNGVPASGSGYLDVAPEAACLTPDNVASDLSVSLGLFDQLCAASIGFTDLDPGACNLTVYNSQVSPLTGGVVDPDTTAGTVGALLSNLLTGNPIAGFVGDALAPGISDQLVALGADPCDGLLADCATPADALGQINDPTFYGSQAPGLNAVLTQQQKALLGCGEFYGTNCETDGIDLLHTEFSALTQSWPEPDALTDDTSVPQPGTVGWVPSRGPVGARESAGVQVQLPGARGPNDPTSALDDDGVAASLATGNSTFLWNPRIDGCTGPVTAAALGVGALVDCAGATTLLHPNGQQFSSEMAALSWNLLMTLVSFSFASDEEIEPDEFDPTDPLRTDGCSFRRPGACAAVVAFKAGGSLPLLDDASGINPRWVWENGAELEVDVATGDLAPTLGERVYSVGPEVSRVDPLAKGLGFSVGAAPGPVALAVYGTPVACGNGEDDDDDGLVDLDDPGCPFAYASPENPVCDDGLDNNENGLFDFDDPVCRPDFPYAEGPGCGLGAELALVLLPIAALRRRRQKAGRR